ncbi:MAG: hypothetical protein ACYTXP_40165, partial [Nostoc sp.]
LHLLSFIVKEGTGQMDSCYLKTFATNLLMKVDFGVTAIDGSKTPSWLLFLRELNEGGFREIQTFSYDVFVPFTPIRFS